MKKKKKTKVACENSHPFSLLAARDVSPGGTYAHQWQKFHTDDVKKIFKKEIARKVDTFMW